MRDGADRKPGMALERPHRLRASWRRRLARLAVVGIVVALIAQSAHIARVDHDCAAAMKEQAWARAVQACQLELQRTQDPKIGLMLADAQAKYGDAAAARRTASLLLTTPVRSDALFLIGSLARDEDRSDDALTILEAARKAHRAEHRPAKLAKDVGVLAMVRTDRSELAEALRLADECLTQARLASDADLQSYCHLIAAKILTRIGYWPAADQEIELAERLSTNDLQRSDLAYRRASLAQDRGDHATAIAYLTKAMQLRGRAPDVAWAFRAATNLAYSYGEQRRFNEADLHLQTATLLDFEGKNAPERAWTGARIAYRQHDLVRASSLTAAYIQLRNKEDASAPEDEIGRDDRIDVATLQARIELERGDLESAEHWARQGVEQAELVRRAQAELELRPWVLAKRRAPYELLFTALARSHQIDAAAMVFGDWQGRTVQDALATPRPTAPFDGRAMADQLTRLGEWLRVASPAAFASPDPASVLRTMRDIDLVALIVADGEVWRLTASHGPPQLALLTTLAKLEGPLSEFRTHPTDAKLAGELGALVMPDEAFRSQAVLHVLVDGRLGAVPVAALRHGGTPLIAIRPIVHTLRLPEVRCVLPARPGHATVIGATSADLPNAVAEANQVAELLHTTSATGVAATRAALFAAAGDAVLHVAAHAAIGLDGAALVLADGEVSALEISARRVAPALAVLSACDAATSDDLELGGSLVAGFLGAGSRHVVGTLRPITDAGARTITTRFYRADGVADPVRALATVQADLAGTTNPDWPYFAVFGSDVCRDGTPDHASQSIVR